VHPLARLLASTWFSSQAPAAFSVGVPAQADLEPCIAQLRFRSLIGA
jgi:hypothetical protein